mgnify:CR=1 FL=1
MLKKSLAFAKYHHNLSIELSNYWKICCALNYSNRWVDSLSEEFKSKKTTDFPGDTGKPFSYLSIPFNEWSKENSRTIEYIRENTVLNIITLFEVYLYDILIRMIYLEPELVKDSKIQLQANDLIKSLSSTDNNEWFSQKIVDKYLRNKTHKEMIAKIARMIPCDIKKIDDSIELWDKWTYVRNSIVHSGRRVSKDLEKVWNERFPNLGSRLNLKDNELMHLSSIGNKIIKTIDKRAVEVLIKDEDAKSMIREIYINKGIVDTKEIKTIVSKTIGYRAKTEEVTKVLAYQRRNENYDTGFFYDLNLIKY